MKRISVAAATTCALFACGAGAAPASAACSGAVVANGTATITCSPGLNQVVNIPATAKRVTFTVYGGAGGQTPLAFGHGANGGVRASYVANGPYALSLDVGTKGADTGINGGLGGIPGGGNGATNTDYPGVGFGAGGGGLSSVMLGARRLITAGGGGGDGGSGQWGRGGGGGGGGSSAVPLTNGGDGGICNSPANCFSSGGHGGTGSAGGASTGGGTPGSADTGGNAKPGSAGGGGGAGCFGGGGAGDAPPPPDFGGASGGGGGGSTCTDPALTDLSYPFGPDGDGSAVITYAVATGSTGVSGPVTGVVTITPPGGPTTTLGPGQTIPPGSTVDTTKGTVTVTTTDGKGGTQSVNLGGGKIALGKTTKGVTGLTLKSKLGPCTKKAKKKAKRRLRAKGSGKYRVKGKYATVTTTGKFGWSVYESCSGTLTKVSKTKGKGKVKVRDLARKKTVTVKKGKRYLAKARKR